MEEEKKLSPRQRRKRRRRQTQRGHAEGVVLMKKILKEKEK